MKAIKVKIYQQCANFRIHPHVSSWIPTYPLPPYSTVSGMIHYACAWTEYHPLQISICKTKGTGTSQMLETYYVGEGVSKELTKDFANRWTHIFKDNGQYHGWTKDIRKTDLLWEREYIIHVVPSEEDFETIYESLKYPKKYLSLGRWEDIIMFEDVTIVELEENMRAVERFDADFYVPASYVADHNFICTCYKITKNYDIVRNTRRFNKVKTYLINPFFLSEEKSQNFNCLHDSDSCPVFLA